ncbi:unnamed protein product [Echinostoma caproni]|uniref:Reverse transcriptase domain-containing protein n=1 Tax=Echinostoma caproni TaxID=27848 RepID=A0A183AJ57_9TREM|nr:unnamed protein product [Echinostoma caproni]
MWNWLLDFLIHWKFCVRVGKLLSAWYSAPSEVPEGSVLGPVLFVVYVNDLLGQLRSPSLMYADDTKIWRTTEDPNNRGAQADLNNLAQWADTWALPVNTAKCAHLRLGRADSEKFVNFESITERVWPSSIDGAGKIVVDNTSGSDTVDAEWKPESFYKQTGMCELVCRYRVPLQRA